jgi:hypothetical protein
MMQQSAAQSAAAKVETGVIACPGAKRWPQCHTGFER